MRTVSRESSSKYLIKTEKPTRLQNEDGESRNLFWLCELLLFSCYSFLAKCFWTNSSCPNSFLEPAEPWPEDVPAVPQTAQEQQGTQGQGTTPGVSIAREWNHKRRLQPSSKELSSTGQDFGETSSRNKGVRWGWPCCQQQLQTDPAGSSALQATPGC